MPTKPSRTLLLILSILYLAAYQPVPAPQWRWERAEAGLARQAIVTSVAANPLVSMKNVTITLNGAGLQDMPELNLWVPLSLSGH